MTDNLTNTEVIPARLEFSNYTTLLDNIAAGFRNSIGRGIKINLDYKNLTLTVHDVQGISEAEWSSIKFVDNVNFPTLLLEKGVFGVYNSQTGQYEVVDWGNRAYSNLMFYKLFKIRNDNQSNGIQNNLNNYYSSFPPISIIDNISPYFDNPTIGKKKVVYNFVFRFFPTMT